MKNENVETAQKLKHSLLPEVERGTFLHFSLKDFSKLGTMTSAEGIDNTGGKHQVLNSASFNSKQCKGESSKMKVDTDQKACNLKQVDPQKLHEHLFNLFPDTYEFEKETVVQLWVAEGFFEPEKEVRMEDLANSIFDYLIEKKYVSLSRFDRITRSVKYKITNVIRPSLRRAPQVGPCDVHHKLVT
ncbi:hypothetical protein P3S67_024466 [Capsicum chacoense]